jgi:hypothetical protein
MRFGLWIEEPGNWTGWFGLASADADGSPTGTFVPWAFDTEDGAEGAAMNFRQNRPNAKVEVKLDPPFFISWDENKYSMAVA